MRKSVMKGMLRELTKLRASVDSSDLDYNFGAASGFINGVFANHDELLIAEWDRMAKLADNAWRNRLKELEA